MSSAAPGGLAVIVCADGGSRGNPGVAGYGAAVLDASDEQVLVERSEGIGRATNNVAEYRGLIAGLAAARELAASRVEVRMDSKLVVEQMAGRWKVKHPGLQALHREAQGIARAFSDITFTWVPRAKNALADRLANEAMDAAGSGVKRPAPPPATREAAPSPVTPDAVPRPTASPDAPSPVGLTPGARGRGAAAADPGRPTTTLLMTAAETAQPAEWRFPDRADVDLSDVGVRQAQAAATRLEGSCAAIVSSPLRHARQTADALGSAAVPVVIDEGLAECDFGEWAGLTLAEVRSRWPTQLDDWFDSPDAAPPRGESLAALARRVRAARDRVLARHGGQSVLIVSHVAPVKTLIRLGLDAGPASLHRLHLDPAGLSSVRWHADGRASVRLVNDTSHL